MILSIISDKCRQFSGWATLEEAERVRHERKPSERFPGACSQITSGLPTNRDLPVDAEAFIDTNELAVRP